MASPQKENGFTPIANEILEKIVNTALLGSEYQVLFFVIRKTYGYHKKEDKISLTQFEKGTGLSRPTVVKALKNLVSRNILLRSEKLYYKFNKDYESWLVNTALLVKHNSPSGKAGLTEIGKHRLTHKRKKDMTKDNKTEQAPQEIVFLIESFVKINPACKRMYGNKTQRQACIDLIETYGFDRVLKVISETLPRTNKMTAQFFPNIGTPLQLFDKWQKLEDAIFSYREKNKIKNNNVFW